MYRVEITLDKAALAHNVNTYRSMLPPNCKVMGVVKADAYGHGAVAVSRELSKIGVDRFGVATLPEAVELREHDIKGEILILGYTPPDALACLHDMDITQTATCREHADQIAEYARSHGRKIKVNIAIDTGMHRIGFAPDDFDGVASVYADDSLDVCGIFSHMCVADTDEEIHTQFSREQGEKFKKMVETLKARGIATGTAHLLSSYAAVNYPEYAFDYARIGVLMYGMKSNDHTYFSRTFDPHPVMTLKTIVTSVREIAPGDTVGYGRTYTADRPTRVASLAIGYADGIPRCLSGGKMRAIIRGEYAVGLGRICMDQMMVDVTDIPNAAIGDEAVLIGSAGGKTILVEELAEAADTITHEIMTGLGSRVEGRYFV